ncbi:hypothetical protein BpHYR1_035389 [Brachionus plicatilis]|uniref:Uncharacterized protein n=1 Tax=Brachionus plicatilis TaxID=10195 RepID=A0A3M7SDF2_BRAPC|nr:hypothetical protein BpHYR1_035389 [Brachionus plicatilis]
MILFSLLKLHVARAHPNIYKSIEVFQIQETATFTKYKHDLLNRPAHPRKKLDVVKDTELKIYKKMLDENSIDVDEKEPEPDSDNEDEDLVDSSDEEDTQRINDCLFTRKLLSLILFVYSFLHPLFIQSLILENKNILPKTKHCLNLIEPVLCTSQIEEVLLLQSSLYSTN